MAKSGISEKLALNIGGVLEIVDGGLYIHIEGFEEPLSLKDRLAHYNKREVKISVASSIEFTPEMLEEKEEEQD